MEATASLLVSTSLTLIEGLLPYINDASMVAKVLTALETYLPVVVQFAQDLVTPFKNIIAALTNNGAVTDDQLTSLKALDAQADAAFDAAVAAYQAANPATPAA